MKRFATLIALLTFFIGNNVSIAQDLSESQQEIYAQFSLYPNDTRGVEFVSATPETIIDCSQSYPDVKTAIEAVFNSLVMTDYLQICVESHEQNYFNRGLSILDLVDIYITILTSN